MLSLFKKRPTFVQLGESRFALCPLSHKDTYPVADENFPREVLDFHKEVTKDIPAFGYFNSACYALTPKRALIYYVLCWIKRNASVALKPIHYKALEYLSMDFFYDAQLKEILSKKDDFGYAEVIEILDFLDASGNETTFNPSKKFLERFKDA